MLAILLFHAIMQKKGSMTLSPQGKQGAYLI